MSDQNQNQNEDVMFNAHDLISAVASGEFDPDDVVSEAVESEGFINQNYTFQTLQEDPEDEGEDEDE